MRTTFFSSVAAASFLVAMVVNSVAEPRTFTSSDGKEIKAEPLGVSEGKATLKLVGGKTFVVPLGRLSETDQAFLTEWAKTNKSYKLTDLRFEAKKSRETERKKAEKKKKAEKTSDISWEGILQNNIRETIGEIVIEYTIYRRDFRKTKYGTSNSIEEVEGKVEVGSIGAGEIYEFNTEIVEEFTKVTKGEKGERDKTERQDVAGAVFKVSIGGRELLTHEDPRGIIDKVEDEREKEKEKEEREAERDN